MLSPISTQFFLVAVHIGVMVRSEGPSWCKGVGCQCLAVDIQVHPTMVRRNARVNGLVPNMGDVRKEGGRYQEVIYPFGAHLVGIHLFGWIAISENIPQIVLCLKVQHVLGAGVFIKVAHQDDL